MQRASLFAAAIAAVALVSPRVSVAAPSTIATQVISYVAGGPASTGYDDPDSALGGLNPIADPNFGNTILSPFNPPYLPSDLVIIGDGGHLTLRLNRSVYSQDGPEIGVFSNNGLVDVAYPAGQNANPATLFSDPSRAVVSVSQDGSHFVPLGSNPLTFDIPSNYYSDLGPSPAGTSVPGRQSARVFKPFTSPLSAFDGLDWPATRALFDGSAGGTWFDISATGLSSVQYVRFDVPDGADYRMVVDAVSGARNPNTLIPEDQIVNWDSVYRGLGASPVPEPAALTASVLAALGYLSVRRRVR